MVYNIGAILLLVLAIFCIVQVVQSGMDSTKKLIWILVILFLPLIGSILWLVIGKNA